MTDKPKTADWEPGTLEHTRKNIGEISKAEAERMTQILGGEIMYEKSDAQKFEQTKKNKGAIVRRSASSSTSDTSSSHEAKIADTQKEQSAQTSGKADSHEILPSISNRINAQIDKLMMSSEYKIKPDYGIFNFIRIFKKNGTEKIIPEFVSVTLELHIKTLESFINNIKAIIQLSPNTYKTRIVNDTDPRFKLVRMVADWKIQTVKFHYTGLKTLRSDTIITADLVPFVRSIYAPLISLYYFGEAKIPKLLKEIFNDLTEYPNVQKDILHNTIKQSITEWLYLSTEVIRKLYPLLMRMSSTVCEDYPDFMTNHVAEILKFLGMHKFDLLLPEKEKPEAEPKSRIEEKKQEPDERGKRDEIVDTGISILDRLFPQAGFNMLDTHPDMFSYFQPIYNFPEGFNMLSPNNPMQVTVVLMRIIEDFFRGCRNVIFTNEKEESAKKEVDSMEKILDDWSAYREENFEKLYCSPLRSLVNETYSKLEFAQSQFGKKYFNSILWQTKNHFLPHFRFQQLTLERPSEESKYAPIFVRTIFTRSYLTEAVRECDTAASTRGAVRLVQNPWEHYKFDLPNEISKRLDVLLGAQNTTDTTNATNANLLKYTLCVFSVLDWWINNQASPAYATDPMDVYRVSVEDGKPAFSTFLRSDQNKLFADAIKAAYAKKAQ